MKLSRITTLGMITCVLGTLGGVAGVTHAVGLALRLSATTPASVTGDRPDVVVIGTPGLRWDDVNAVTTPGLSALTAHAAIGSLSIKATDPVTCPDDGWLTLGAGNRITAGDWQHGRCPTMTTLTVVQAGVGATVPAIPALAQHNARLDDGARIGTLAENAGSCVSAAGPGAALAAANSSGHVDVYLADPLAAASDSAFLRRCPVTLLTGTPGDVVALVAAVTAGRPDIVVLVVGLAETGGDEAHLHVALATGPGFAAGWLDSASTRRAPFVQLVDVTETVLAERGVRSSPSSTIGELWRTTSTGSTAQAATETAESSRIAGLVDLDRAAQRQAGAVVPFYLALTGLMLLAGGVGWAVARRRSAQRAHRTRVVTGYLCVISALVPVASFTANLVPWWRAAHPLLALAAATSVGLVIGTVLVAIVDVVIWKRRPIGLVGGVGLVTSGIIGLDLLTGAHLQIFSMAGYSPLVAGRFAGIGNVAFGIFAAGALFVVTAATTTVSSPRAKIGVVAVLGVLAVGVDGGPWWGSDVGGVLALVPTFVLLAGWVSGVSISWRRVLSAIVAAVLVVSVLGTLDYVRPADRQTHLGRFVGKLLHGGAWTIVRRKAIADISLLTHSPLTLLIPLLVFAAIAVLVWPRGLLKRAFSAEPLLRVALGGVLVMSLIGAVLNDSGVVIPALAVLVALPATVAVVLRAVPVDE